MRIRPEKKAAGEHEAPAKAETELPKPDATGVECPGSTTAPSNGPATRPASRAQPEPAAKDELGEERVPAPTSAGPACPSTPLAAETAAPTTPSMTIRDKGRCNHTHTAADRRIGHHEHDEPRADGKNRLNRGFPTSGDDNMRNRRKSPQVRTTRRPSRGSPGRPTARAANRDEIEQQLADMRESVSMDTTPPPRRHDALSPRLVSNIVATVLTQLAARKSRSRNGNSRRTRLRSRSSRKHRRTPSVRRTRRPRNPALRRTTVGTPAGRRRAESPTKHPPPRHTKLGPEGWEAVKKLLANIPDLPSMRSLTWLAQHSVNSTRGERVQARHVGGIRHFQAAPRQRAEATPWQRGARLGPSGVRVRGPRSDEARARRQAATSTRMPGHN